MAFILKTYYSHTVHWMLGKYKPQTNLKSLHAMKSTILEQSVLRLNAILKKMTSVTVFLDYLLWGGPNDNFMWKSHLLVFGI